MPHHARPDEATLARAAKEISAATTPPAFDAMTAKWGEFVRALDADALDLLAHWLVVLSPPRPSRPRKTPAR